MKRQRPELPIAELDSHKFEQKWSFEVMMYGFTQVPNLLISCQGHLKITDGEMMTLLSLLTHWYRHDTKIYPSIERLAKFSHKGYSTVQKRLRTLEQKGFIKRRHSGGKTTTYDILPCVAALYRHSLVCPEPPRKQSRYWDKTRSVPTSIITNKEDEARRRQHLRNNKNPSDSTFSIGDIFNAA